MRLEATTTELEGATLLVIALEVARTGISKELEQAVLAAIALGADESRTSGGSPHFGVSEKSLLEANRMEPSRLSPGQRLVLPSQ